MKRQAQEQQQQASSEAQVKLAAAQASRDKLQTQVDNLQDSNGSLHKQLADAHGKVCVCVCANASCIMKSKNLFVTIFCDRLRLVSGKSSTVFLPSLSECMLILRCVGAKQLGDSERGICEGAADCH